MTRQQAVMQAQVPAASAVPTVVVCIATTGRRDVLTEAVRLAAAQTRPPQRVAICPGKPDDVDHEALASLPTAVEVLPCGSGLTIQRNMLLRAVGDADVVLFVDDDFLLAPDFLARLVELFAARPDCMIATGLVLADGALNAGYSVAEGRAILAAPRHASAGLAPCFNAYGCNMAVRWSALRDRNCWFDERLPLYGWAEDVDFSRQAARHGSVLKSQALVGVHLGVKHGRVSGVRFGYSQIANQIYLGRKGTITVAGGMRKVLENLLANGVGALRNNEPHVDRRGRLVGNLRGLADMVRGRLAPERVFDL